MEMSSQLTRYASAKRVDSTQVAAQAELFTQDTTLRELLDCVPTLLAILNEQRQIVFSNRALLKFLAAADESAGRGLRPGELFNCTNAHLMPGGCGTAEACRNCGAVNAILSGLRERDDVQDYRLTREIDGHHYSLDLRIHTRPFLHCGERFVVFTIEDISHQKRRSALEHIFFHDILNLAGSVKGFSQLLCEYPQGNETHTEMLQLIDSAATQIVEEINAQRILLAAENGELKLNLSTLNARAMVEQSAEIYRRHPVSDNRILSVQSGCEDLWFVSDAALVGRVLGNMLKNALEASRAGETVSIGCRGQQDEVCFWVHNPGTIPQATQLQIFQRSFSTKGAGRGLGTYSMRLLTEEYLDGNLSFSSTAAEGTTFFARYPLQVNSPASVPL
jgi:signal transduction histidine kinase